MDCGFKHLYKLNIILYEMLQFLNWWSFQNVFYMGSVFIFVQVMWLEGVWERVCYDRTCGVRGLYGELLSRSARMLVKESISASRLERLSSIVFSGLLIWNTQTQLPVIKLGFWKRVALNQQTHLNHSWTCMLQKIIILYTKAAI